MFASLFKRKKKKAAPAKQSIDVGVLLRKAGEQFQGLNTSQPGQWPLVPRLAAAALVTLITAVLGWVLLLGDVNDELEAERDREPTLKADYTTKLAQAVNLGELKKQKLQVQEYVTQLEKQLPGKAEMDALLSDINQAGVGRGLQFELFRPGQVVIKDYYAELPISIKVAGRYHDIGTFAADVANLSRIVTLHDLSITPRDSGGGLAMEATARTYRYLDSAEVLEARKSSNAKKGKK